MTYAILLAPGDVIKRSSEELKQRQIQINLVDWIENKSEKEKEPKLEGESGKQDNLNNGEGTQQKDGEKEKDGEETQDANVDRRLHTTVGSGSSAKGSGERADKNVDGRDGKTRRGGGDADEGAGVAGASRRGWVVLTDEIARAIESKYGTKVDVYREEASAQIIEIERSLQKELGITREGAAEQTEKLRDLRRKERGELRTKTVVKGDRKHGGNSRDCSSTKGSVGEEVQEETTKVGITIEGVMSQKKLLSMIGGVERKAAPIGARESAVMLVSNNIKDVARATAYFTSPTGDPNWKEVAREASKKKNILAYSSTGGDTKTEFLHLIDHL
uniref:VP6 n=1 Tax=Bluetongue virus TaxID=40051 RepID=A0A2H4KN46_BTV|nr:VP6 [Bluetongue virus]ASW41587.1 VP6 [Bluetongue virus]ASW41601.1 VP6 [Bluetongue virus]